jgi:virginiamycin B lyase
MQLSLSWREPCAGLTLMALAACGSPAGAPLYPNVSYGGPSAVTVVPDATKITAYTVPTANVDPYDIALGKNGNLYATQPILNQGAGTTTYLWQISEKGHFSSIKPDTGSTGPVGITGGQNATVYFGLQHYGEELGSFSGGKLKIKKLAGPAVNAIYFLTQAKDGSIWFSDPGDYEVGHIVGSHYKVFLAPTKYCSPYGITVGSDENVWVAEQCPLETGKLGRITPAGSWKEYTLPTKNEQPYGIAAGPDRNLWYTGVSINAIGRATTGGKITEFSLSGIGQHFGAPAFITVGNDHALWFTVQEANEIGRITTGGSATEYPIPSCGSQCSIEPGGITAGVGRTVWFTTITGNQVDKLAY